MNMASASTTVELVKGLIEAGEVSQAGASREIGISGAALSGWLRGTYTGDAGAIESKVLRWLDARERKSETLGAMPAAPVWVETKTAEKIFGALGYAQMAGDLAVIYGAAGVGKTHSLRRYAEVNPNAWVVTMTSAHRGATAALEEIAVRLSIRDTPLRGSRILREIIRRVEGTGGLLIIDEAQHLLPVALEVIRSIHDATGVGVVLCGNESVYAKLTGGTRTATFAQLFSRIGKRLRITGALKSDIWAVAKHFGVEETDAKPVLYDIGLKPGGLRAVVKTLRLAGMFAAGASISPAHIRAAWRDLSDAVIREGES